MPGQHVRSGAEDHRIRIEVDGEPSEALAGESLAAALMSRRAAGRPRAWRRVFCNMGVCGDCTVIVVGSGGERASRRACVTPVVAGMRVMTTGDGIGA